MKVVPARGFARKWPAKDGVPSKTLLVIVALGDLTAVEDEALHELNIMDDTGTLTLAVKDRAVQSGLEAWDISDVVERGMSGPLRPLGRDDDQS